MESSLSIINGSYEAYKIIVDLNNSLEKRWKYSVGLSLENGILELLENLIMAKNAPKPLKGPYLIKAGANLEACRLKLRLMLELKLANEVRILKLQENLVEIGKQLGGWTKYTWN